MDARSMLLAALLGTTTLGGCANAEAQTRTGGTTAQNQAHHRAPGAEGRTPPAARRTEDVPEADLDRCARMRAMPSWCREEERVRVRRREGAR
jgi:hypothetical protein